MRSLVRLACLVALLMLGAPAPVLGQGVRGTLTDSISGLPIPRAAVRLMNFQGTERARTSTDDDGAFVLRVPAPGAYWIQVEPVGYQLLVIEPFVIERTDTLTLPLNTRPAVTELEGVVVRGASRRQSRNYAGFLDRQRSGWASRTLGPEQVKRQGVVFPSDLLTNLVPGLDGQTATFRNRGRICSALIIVDGFPLPRNVSVNEYVQASAIRAVEVYTQAELAPPTLTMRPFNQCGVIALWTSFGLGID